MTDTCRNIAKKKGERERNSDQEVEGRGERAIDGFERQMCVGLSPRK